MTSTSEVCKRIIFIKATSTDGAATLWFIKHYSSMGLFTYRHVGRWIMTADRTFEDFGRRSDKTRTYWSGVGEINYLPDLYVYCSELINHRV